MQGTMSCAQQVAMRRTFSGQPMQAQPRQSRPQQMAAGVQCSAGVVEQTVKLPASHQRASAAALQQLQATKTVNRKLSCCSW